MSYYPIYLVEYLGVPRNHDAIFLENGSEGAGTLFHVKGSIQEGMSYEVRVTTRMPDLSNSFVSKSQVGWVRTEDADRVDAICRGNPPPAKQFNGPKRINKREPLRRWQE